MFLRIFVNWSMCVFVHLTIRLCVDLSGCMLVYLSIGVFVDLSIGLFVACPPYMRLVSMSIRLLV